ncbi:hypothetical protein LIER_40705 [Lithospermum erythrorhizon]|uniref:Reverse transcriptase Ty1/copia-type domain-containing protein n=1 Tax=Lithospermum erythrorhizon TaxID=34254 RepID=A0AAV3R2A0_LITER
MGRIIIVSIYVDDLIYTGDDETLIKDFKAAMIREFDMTNLRLMYYFLEIEVTQHAREIFINQSQYANNILKRFGMIESNSTNISIAKGTKIDKDLQATVVNETSYKQIIENLMYLTTTRPNLMFVTGLIGRKSTGGYVFLFSTGAVAWYSKKQPIVTLSTIEAEFVATAMCTCQAIWIIRILKELGYDEGTYLSKKGIVSLVHCGTADQVVDIMSKPLKIDTFQKLRKMLGMYALTEIS